MKCAQDFGIVQLGLDFLSSFNRPLVVDMLLYAQLHVLDLCMAQFWCCLNIEWIYVWIGLGTTN